MKPMRQFLARKLNSLFTYPLHFSLIYFYASLFGSLKLKIWCSTFRLPHYAFCIFTAAARAKKLGITSISVIEFGVANGRGLIAMAKYAALVSKKMGVVINVIGFDSGQGMPNYEDYKDHPEIYVGGDYPMQQPEKLKKILPANSNLVILDLNEADWTKHLLTDSPIGFISIDVDYYSSTRNILSYIPGLPATSFLPNTLFYFDDILLDNHNIFQGELLAIREFNEFSSLRKFDCFANRLKQQILFTNSAWAYQIYQLHILDHPIRQNGYRTNDEAPRILANKYLK
jgi:hypothetical protein